MFYTSQSATSCHQTCHRRRWFQYHYLGHGITLTSQSVPLLQGSCVHEAIELMVKKYIKTKQAEIDIDYGVEVGIRKYWTDVKQHGLTGTPTTEQDRVIREQVALVEVLIRLWVMMEWPIIKAYYKIIAVEFEIQYPIGDDIIFQSKPDMLLIHRGSGSLVNYSLKTLKGIFKNTEETYAVGNQSITEPWCTSWYLNRKFGELAKDSHTKIPTTSTGIRFCYLIKGDRKEATKGNKDYYTNNPFLYAWRKVGLTQVEYAWNFYTNNPNNKSGYGRLGKGWEEFTVFDDSLGVEAWMLMLREGIVDPDLHDRKGTVFEQHIHGQAEVYVPQHIAEDRMFQLEEIEKEIWKRIRELQGDFDVDLNSGWLGAFFPMNTQACFFPQDCDYLPICANGNRHYRQEIADNPLSSEFGPLYQIRVPHHKSEKEYYEQTNR